MSAIPARLACLVQAAEDPARNAPILGVIIQPREGFFHPDTQLRDNEASMEGLRAGSKFDRYELLCPVGEGGMAAVWLARMRGKRGFEKLVAIKTIRVELGSDARFEEMFLDEARIASGVHHPNVAQIIDLGEEDGSLFLVLEYVEGETLSRLRRAVWKSGSSFPLGLALRITAHACAGLHAAHELLDAQGSPLNIVHRDVSPQNILITDTGTVKVIDFGIAKAKNRIVQTDEGDRMLKGKIPYMPPEQALGQDIDRRADVWALGVVLYELLAGRLPFDAPTHIEAIQRITGTGPYDPLPPEVPEPISAIVRTALCRDVTGRFPSASAMQREIERVLVALNSPTTSEDLASFVRYYLEDRIEKRKRIVSGALSESEERDRLDSVPTARQLVDNHATNDGTNARQITLNVTASDLTVPTRNRTVPIFVGLLVVAAATGIYFGRLPKVTPADSSSPDPVSSLPTKRSAAAPSATLTNVASSDVRSAAPKVTASVASAPSVASTATSKPTGYLVLPTTTAKPKATATADGPPPRSEDCIKFGIGCPE